MSCDGQGQVIEKKEKKKKEKRKANHRETEKMRNCSCGWFSLHFFFFGSNN
jgi:hypothetical protein